MPQKKTGEDISAGGQGQEPENAEYRAGIDGQRPQGASGPAEAEGDEPRQQRMPAFAKPGPSLLDLSNGTLVYSLRVQDGVMRNISCCQRLDMT